MRPLSAPSLARSGLLRAGALALLCSALTACRGEACKTLTDCPAGFYCLPDPDRIANGSCERECVTAEDCPAPNPTLQFGLCNNLGRCTVTERTPRLRVLSPENDTLLEEGTRQIQLAGEVETAAERVEVTMQPLLRSECGAIEPLTLALKNGEVGKSVTLSFVTPDVDLDPGITVFRVTARVGQSEDSLEHIVEVPCPGCATISVASPRFPATVTGLELDDVHGKVSPASVRQLIWRVQSSFGDIIDGAVEVVNGDFVVPRIPVFAGVSRIRYVVSGVGSGLGESRCSVSTISAVTRETGLRVLLTWDGLSSDLDVHLVGPGGGYKESGKDLYSRQGQTFGGSVEDDFDGLGPETLSSPSLPDGVYGLVVEPVADANDPGSNAVMRVLWDGRLLSKAPYGPQYLSVSTDELWVVGTLNVSGGQATFNRMGAVISAEMPPTRPPADWPNFY